MDGIQQSVELVLQDIQPALVQQKVQNAFFGPPGFCLALFDNQFGKGIPDTGVGTEFLQRLFPGLKTQGGLDIQPVVFLVADKINFGLHPFFHPESRQSPHQPGIP